MIELLFVNCHGGKVLSYVLVYFILHFVLQLLLKLSLLFYGIVTGYHMLLFSQQRFVIEHLLYLELRNFGICFLSWLSRVIKCSNPTIFRVILVIDGLISKSRENRGHWHEFAVHYRLSLQRLKPFGILKCSGDMQLFGFPFVDF